MADNKHLLVRTISSIFIIIVLVIPYLYYYNEIVGMVNQYKKDMLYLNRIEAQMKYENWTEVTKINTEWQSDVKTDLPFDFLERRSALCNSSLEYAQYSLFVSQKNISPNDDEMDFCKKEFERCFLHYTSFLNEYIENGRKNGNFFMIGGTWIYKILHQGEIQMYK